MPLPLPDRGSPGGAPEGFSNLLIMKPKEWTALALLFSGIIMAFTALLMPPPGQIHDSVLYIFAQILIYCGSIFGIDSYISRKLRDMNPPNHPKPL